MNLSLTNIKIFLSNRRTLIIILVLTVAFLILIISLIFVPKPKKPITATPLPVSGQPVKDGKFDETAPTSQKSKAAIEKLRPNLPLRRAINTSTGNKVAVAVFGKPRDLYTLYVEMFPVNFQSTYSDPNLAKNILDFRETATVILNWIIDQGVSPSDIFISWGNKAYIQKSAEGWLIESPQFPKVVKKDDRFVFETEPVKNP